MLQAVDAVEQALQEEVVARRLRFSVPLLLFPVAKVDVGACGVDVGGVGGRRGQGRRVVADAERGVRHSGGAAIAAIAVAAVITAVRGVHRGVDGVDERAGVTARVFVNGSAGRQRAAAAAARECLERRREAERRVKVGVLEQPQQPRLVVCVTRD